MMMSVKQKVVDDHQRAVHLTVAVQRIWMMSVEIVGDHGEPVQR
jgi:hypothetical protein